jgi:hypothetical protein
MPRADSMVILLAVENAYCGSSSLSQSARVSLEVSLNIVPLPIQTEAR